MMFLLTSILDLIEFFLVLFIRTTLKCRSLREI